MAADGFDGLTTFFGGRRIHGGRESRTMAINVQGELI